MGTKRNKQRMKKIILKKNSIGAKAFQALLYRSQIHWYDTSVRQIRKMSVKAKVIWATRVNAFNSLCYLPRYLHAHTRKADSACWWWRHLLIFHGNYCELIIHKTNWDYDEKYGIAVCKDWNTVSTAEEERKEEREGNKWKSATHISRCGHFNFFFCLHHCCLHHHSSPSAKLWQWTEMWLRWGKRYLRS